MKKNRLKTLLRGLTVCAGYAAACLGILAVRAVLVILLCAGLLAGLLRGCLTEHASPHSRREVAAYLQWACPGEDITVSRKYRELPKEAGSLTATRVWDCWFDDMPEMVFHVESSWWGGGHFPAKAGYDLSTDLKSTLWNHYLEQYQTGGGGLDAWTIQDGKLSMAFSSMAEALPAAEQLQALYDWYEAQPHTTNGFSAVCTFTGGPLPLKPLWQLSDTFYIEHHLPEDNVVGWTNSSDSMLRQCRGVLKYYYGFYNLPCPDFTAEELADYGYRKWLWYADIIQRDYPNAVLPLGSRTEFIPYEEWGPLFRGVGISSRQISFGGLYELLVRLDRTPEGTPERFTAQGEDGAVYAFSYDFSEESEDGTRWYYTKDGDVCPLDAKGPILELRDPAVSQTLGLWFSYN